MIDEKRLIQEFDKLDDNCNLFRWKSADKIRTGIRRIINSQPKVDRWIKCSERLPTMEECWENDCRFIVTDGNRRYERHFDYIDKEFVQIDDNLISAEDRCVIAWQPFPNYKENNYSADSGDKISASSDHIMRRFIWRL